MKWNWGTGIVAGMALFIGFILYLVITMSTSKKYNHDLVTDAYYAKEMVYQNEIDQEKNLAQLSAPIEGKRTDQGWQLIFPPEISTQNSNGTVFLYRPSNQQLDFDLPLVLSGSYLLIPDKKLLDGRWNITVAWETDSIPYLYKKSIVY